MENKPWNRAWNTSWNNRKSEHARSKPDGGFCFIPAMALIRAWRAYKDEIIRLYDLRVWFACFELVARRCNVAPNRFPRFTFAEIHRLVGGADAGNVQTAVRRLTNAGLLDWSERHIQFPAVATDVESICDFKLRRMIRLVKNNRRKVPVPRRTVRFLVGLSKPVSIATILGHLLRCLYYRNGLCVPDGRCKASWIADAFGVDIRNVKAARLRLSEIGWLVIDTSSQTAMNLWGAAVRVNLSWKHEHEHEHEREGGGSQLPPPSPPTPAELPPPRNNRKLSSRMIHQKPAGAERTGAFRKAEIHARLSDVNPEDLRDTSRLEVLFAQARRRGWTSGGEAARLRFFAAAEHAKSHGRTNPCGLFVWLIRQQRWNHLTLKDEDRARTALGRVECGSTRSRRSRTALASATSASGIAVSRTDVPVAAGTVLMDALTSKHPSLARLSSLLRASGGSASRM